MQSKKRHRSEAEQWYFRLMNDPKQFEKKAFTDGIKRFNSVINECQKMYEETPATDRLIRDEILEVIEQSKRELSKIQVRYEIFKKLLV